MVRSAAPRCRPLATFDTAHPTVLIDHRKRIGIGTHRGARTQVHGGRDVLSDPLIEIRDARWRSASSAEVAQRRAVEDRQPDLDRSAQASAIGCRFEAVVLDGRRIDEDRRIAASTSMVFAARSSKTPITNSVAEAAEPGTSSAIGARYGISDTGTPSTIGVERDLDDSSACAVAAASVTSRSRRRPVGGRCSEYPRPADRRSPRCRGDATRLPGRRRRPTADAAT